MSEPTATIRPRRRWFRFSLRTLLIFTVLVGLLMGWVAKERMQSRREREIGKRLQERGWLVFFGGPFDPYLARSSEPWWRKIARQVLGERIQHLGTSDAPITDLGLLTDSTNLRSVYAQGIQVNELTPLVQFTTIEGLNLGNTHVRDLTPLYRLKKLKEVSLQNTRVTKKQINALQNALPDCVINHDFEP